MALNWIQMTWSIMISKFASLCNNNVVATVQAHCRLICSGTMYSISISGLDDMDDCTVALLLPPSVKWK